MSVPPGTPPPSTYYSPPPPKSNSGGCLKAAGITCGVLLLLGIVVAFVAVRAVKQAVAHHSGIFGQVMNISTTMGNGMKIQQAVVEYHKQHGKYPASLMDLVSDGLVDGKILHSSLDPNPNPGHVSWAYTKPDEGVPGDTEILKLHYRITIPGASSTQQSQESDMVINLNGTTASNSSYHTQTHYGTQTHDGN